MISLSRRELLRRAAWVSAAVVASPAVLAACGGARSPSASPASAAATGTALLTGSRSASATAAAPASVIAGTTQILVGFGTGNAPEQIPARDSLASTFEAAHPGTAIDLLRIPDTDEAQ